MLSIFNDILLLLLYLLLNLLNLNNLSTLITLVCLLLFIYVFIYVNMWWYLFLYSSSCCCCRWKLSNMYVCICMHACASHMLCMSSCVLLVRIVAKFLVLLGVEKERVTMPTRKLVIVGSLAHKTLEKQLVKHTSRCLAVFFALCYWNSRTLSLHIHCLDGWVSEWLACLVAGCLVGWLASLMNSKVYFIGK